jgi:signal transduction histidine kinase
VRIGRDGDDIVVQVSDDGVGGAQVEAGTGLRGLQDRLAALDGRLDLHSPPGGGTVLRATIPCAATTLVAEAHDADRPPLPASELEPRA